MNPKSKQKLPSLDWLSRAVQRELNTDQPGYELKLWLYPEEGTPAMILSPLDEKPFDETDSPEKVIKASRPSLDIGINLDLLRRFYGKDGVSDSALKLIDTIPHDTADPALFGYAELVPGARITMEYWCGRFILSPPSNLMILDDTKLEDASHVLLDITSRMVDENAWNAGGYFNIWLRPERQPRPNERHISTFDVEGFRREFIVLDLAATRRLGLLNPEYL